MIKEFYVVCEIDENGGKDTICIVVKESANILTHLSAIQNLTAAHVYLTEAAALDRLRELRAKMEE